MNLFEKIIYHLGLIAIGALIVLVWWINRDEFTRGYNAAIQQPDLVIRKIIK